MTRVALAFIPEHLNLYLRFGTPDRRIDLDRRRAFAFFASRRVFAYTGWRANDYGTQDWRLAILRSGAAGAALTRVPGVAPGAELLLFARGAAAVKRALGEIDTLEADGFDPAAVSPAFYRQLHNRIAARCVIRPYGEAQHAAWRAAQRLCG